MDKQLITDYLNYKADKYNCPGFIENDPVSIPHLFTKKEDIEIAGFLAATIAWGQRKSILKSARQLMAWMDNAPYDFIKNATPADVKILEKFVYRTFNGTDCVSFMEALRQVYNHGGLERVFTEGFQKSGNIKGAIQFFRNSFISENVPARTYKHVANPEKGSAAKRLNMFLRWMVRNDNKGVDFGLWKSIHKSALMIPLDLHSGTVARKLQLLNRTQNDWKAVEELTATLRSFDRNDPVKYDFALFGIGVNRDLGWKT
jgi:uncharacterized protein (TIGR02757 family)